jgi:hypothetical protein
MVRVPLSRVSTQVFSSLVTWVMVAGMFMPREVPGQTYSIWPKLSVVNIHIQRILRRWIFRILLVTVAVLCVKYHSFLPYAQLYLKKHAPGKTGGREIVNVLGLI